MDLSILMNLQLVLYHCYPGDNWRFYSDAGQTITYWYEIQVGNEEVYPVKVVERFNILGETRNDFVCVWSKVDKQEKICFT